MQYKTYTVSQRKDGLWYAHLTGFPYIPVLGSVRKTKRAAQRVAANCMCLLLSDYLRLPEKKY